MQYVSVSVRLLRAYEFHWQFVTLPNLVHEQIEILRDFLTCRRFNFDHRNVREMSEK